jgi:CO dehydrogenase/acetyl-CoA synthase epsilon subunit
MAQEKYRVLPGPEAFLAPAAALMGAVLPDGRDAVVEGEIVPEGDAFGVIAKKLREAKNPAVCVGPLLLWQWADDVQPKAAAAKALAEACGARIFVMPDYSAKRINPEAEISPNHPNVTILHNDIDVCVFVGVHSHYANFALRLIRGGTSCYTIALCDYAASDEAVISVGNVDAGKIEAIAKKL